MARISHQRASTAPLLCRKRPSKLQGSSSRPPTNPNEDTSSDGQRHNRHHYHININNKQTTTKNISKATSNNYINISTTAENTTTANNTNNNNNHSSGVTFRDNVSDTLLVGEHGAPTDGTPTLHIRVHTKRGCIHWYPQYPYTISRV